MDTTQHNETTGRIDHQSPAASGTLSPRAALRSHKIHTAGLSVQELAERIWQHDWTMKYDPVDDVYTIVCDRLGAAGVADFLAERDFLESLLDESELDPALVA